MASVIWPTGTRGNNKGIRQVYKIMRLKTSTHVHQQPGDAVIIAKGNIIEGIEAKE